MRGLKSKSLNKSDSFASEIKSADPLYAIFEKHLYNIENLNTDRKKFVSNIIFDYLESLKKKSIIIPASHEKAIVDELTTQVSEMLAKKTYGSFDLAEFKQTDSFRTKNLPVRRRKSVRK